MKYWAYLAAAGICEWGWPVGLKLGWHPDGLLIWYWIAFALITLFASGVLLLIAQQKIPMGTAYAVWTGTGAVGAFALGIIFFDEAATLQRFVFIGFIIIGIVGLKLSTNQKAVEA